MSKCLISSSLCFHITREHISNRIGTLFSFEIYEWPWEDYGCYQLMTDEFQYSFNFHILTCMCGAASWLNIKLQGPHSPQYVQFMICHSQGACVLYHVLQVFSSLRRWPVPASRQCDAKFGLVYWTDAWNCIISAAVKYCKVSVRFDGKL